MWQSDKCNNQKAWQLPQLVELSSSFTLGGDASQIFESESGIIAS